MRPRLFIVAMLAPSFSLLVLFYAFPIFHNLSMSFTDLSLLGMSRGGNWIGLANYRELLRSGDFGHIFFNTLIWLTVTSVAIRLLIGLGIAVLLNSTALKRLRTDPRTKTIPVIAVTASAMTYNRVTMLAEGFNGYQTKPISVKDFLEEVHRVLDSDHVKAV